jgi:GNAT superfamily N-acetyltransferase
MPSIKTDAQRYPFHSFHAVEDGELEGAVLHHQSDHCILLSVAEESRVHLYWACESDIELQKALQAYIDCYQKEPVYIEFIPESFVSSLESIGFTEHSEYIDYWAYDLKPVGKIPARGHTDVRWATATDFTAISSITRQCADQSRGFTVETPESLMEWYSGAHNHIVVAISNTQIMGHMLLSLYGFDSPKGTVLWMREITVRPESQRQGVGRGILVYAINWGYKKGATRSFLHCDSKNIASIRLCEHYGYVRSYGRGQINMIYMR